MAFFPKLFARSSARAQWAMLGTLGMILNTLFLQNMSLGIMSFLFYAIPTALATGILLHQKREKRHDRFDAFMIGTIGLLTITVIEASLVYYLYQLNTLAVLCILVSTLLVHIPVRHVRVFVQTLDVRRPNRLLTFLVIAGVLFSLLYRARTVGLLVSPWQQLGPLFFIGYALLVGSYISVIRGEKDRRIHIVFGMILFLLTSSVAVIVYALGFGFDAFVHRATEVWIANHGYILPKQPYYIGQYTLVTYLYHLTQLPIYHIDTLLVPLLTAMTLPYYSLRAIRSSTQFPRTLTSILIIIPLFLPYLSLHLTTPHNLVILLSLIGVFAVLFSRRFEKIPDLLSFLIALSACVTHPLLGIPLLIFVSAVALSGLAQGRHQKIFTSIITIGTYTSVSLLLPILFSINNIRAGGVLPTLVNPFARLPEFLALIQRPYYYADSAPLRFELVYAWQIAVTPLLIIGALGGVRILYTKYTQLTRLYLATSLGLFTSAWLLRSWIVFSDVVAYEQGDFPLRLLKGAVIYLLPLAMIGMGDMITRLRDHLTQRTRGMLLLPIIVAFSLALTVSFYLSYPQKNQKVQFPGYNVTGADYAAVRYIKEQHDEIDYIVLANQLTSAAALTEFSFAKYYPTELGDLYFYAIPTGGPLYADYLRMLYEGQKREYMEHAMDITDVDTAYFVLSSFWKNAPDIIERAKESADEYISLADGQVWVFTYTR